VSTAAEVPVIVSADKTPISFWSDVQSPSSYTNLAIEIISH